MIAASALTALVLAGRSEEISILGQRRCRRSGDLTVSQHPRPSVQATYGDPLRCLAGGAVPSGDAVLLALSFVFFWA